MKKKTDKNNRVIGAVLLAIGVLAIVVAFPHINEMVSQSGSDQAISVEYDKIDSANIGKLIKVSGLLENDGAIADDVFGVSRNTVKLKRVVETYQWAKDCTETCKYELGWHEGLIDSAEFDANHKNPTEVQYESQEFMSEKTTFGAYQIPSALLHKLDYDTTLGPDELIDAYHGDLVVFNEYLTNSTDPLNPKIGDYRISYRYVKDKNITVTAQLAGDTLVEYRKSDKSTVFEIVEGTTEAETQKETNILANVLFSLLMIGGVLIVIASLYQLITGSTIGKK